MARHDDLIAALTAAGWQVAGQRTGMYVRLKRDPDDQLEPSLLIGVDDSYADYAEHIDGTVEMLRREAERGRLAQQVLDALGG